MPIIKKQKDKVLNPARLICGSFILIILLGALLLMLPISSRDGMSTPFADTLFTATSATCVTGLIVEDTSQHWSTFGQVVILSMIQVGGLGLVTLIAFFNFIIGKKLGLRKMQLATNSISSDSFQKAGDLIRNVIKVALTFEVAGALILMTVFVPDFGLRGIFVSFFISISSFCNAGFDILGQDVPYTSLTNYSDNPLVLIIVMLLIICGGLGFVVWHDLIEYRKTKKLTFHTKIVLVITAFLVVFGALAILASEWSNNKTIGTMSFPNKVINSFFQSVSARTAGYNSIDLVSMRWVTKAGMTLLMFIGASPGSTGGGMKTTTIVIILATVVSVLKNRNNTIVFRHKISKSTVYKALTIFTISTFFVTVISIAVHLGSNFDDSVQTIDIIFETVSAFSTTGLSSGITGIANSFSRFMFILAMFFGRVGPISVMLSLMLSGEREHKNQIDPEGKIIVG